MLGRNLIMSSRAPCSLFARSNKLVAALNGSNAIRLTTLRLNDCRLLSSRVCEDCGGTVPKYDQHLLVCTGEGSESDWGPHVEAQRTGVPILHSIDKKLKSCESILGQRKIKISAVTANSSQKGVHDVWLYPGGLSFRLTPEKVDEFVDTLVNQADPAKLLGHQNFGCQPLPSTIRRIAFVCVHGSRDKLCGETGPALKDALVESLCREGIADVKVLGCSHVGGHKFAGNLLIYPEGDWYGNLEAADATMLVREHILNGRILWNHWRGRIGLTKEQQLELRAGAVSGASSK